MAQMDGPTLGPMPTDPEQPRTGPSHHGPVLAAVIAGVLLVGLVLYAAGAGERNAKNACLAAVTDALRAPATAKFEVTLIADEGRGKRVVYGTVDSQNGFGALVRSRFRCDMTGSTVDDASID